MLHPLDAIQGPGSLLGSGDATETQLSALLVKCLIYKSEIWSWDGHVTVQYGADLSLSLSLLSSFPPFLHFL